VSFKSLTLCKKRLTGSQSISSTSEDGASADQEISRGRAIALNPWESSSKLFLINETNTETKIALRLNQELMVLITAERGENGGSYLAIFS